ncbi:hypothetical protein SAMN04487775_11515 [Treponema bryantii]|uniref:Uncharacterized protein n=1 Tax=Treponema bryantii TaxID=163 RepID=A0A1I3NH90_9SPIR|nr:BrnT family toxin [Treponema bryantii]SFJ08674.1 hypothetical protein SAMN04487775_11515 [Treponema bryantii]
MEFEWDEIKNEKNKRKHGIAFESAVFVFNDVNRIEMYDEVHSKIDEDRYITIGKVNKILFVVFTEREDKGRIISARLANKNEKEIYYGNSKIYS